MINPDALIDELTITDPATLSQPWSLTRTYRRTPPGTEMEEFVCTNNRNLPDERGVQTAR